MKFQKFLKMKKKPRSVTLDECPAISRLGGSHWSQFPPAEMVCLAESPHVQAWLSDNCTDKYYAQCLLEKAWPDIKFIIL